MRAYRSWVVMNPGRSGICLDDSWWLKLLFVLRDG